MNRDLPHLVSQVFNTPLMIHGEKLDTILSAVGPRILSGAEVQTVAEMQPRADRFGTGETRFSNGGYLANDGIAVLPVVGTLVRRGSYLDSMSGMTSYARISSAILEMVAHPSVRGVMLEVDSYGGEAGGVFDLADLMSDASAEYAKPIWASVNETAASAAYAIACAADRIWLPQMGAVGSIGVVTAHVDMSKADAASGLKWTYIFNGEYKVDGNPHAPLAADVKARVQADVDDIAVSFHELVASSRDMTVEAVRDTKAGMFRGEKAIEAGLADQLGTFAEAMNAFADFLNDADATGTGTRRSMSAIDQQRNLAMTKRTKAEAETTEAPAADPAPVETTEAPAAEPEPAAAAPTAPAGADAVQAAVAAANARAAELTKLGALAARHGVSFDVAAVIGSGMSVDAARKQITESMAEDTESKVTFNRSTSHTIAAGNDGEGWDRALANVAARRGVALAS